MATEQQNNFPLQKSVLHPTNTFGFNSTSNNDVNSLVTWAAFLTTSLKDASFTKMHIYTKFTHQKCTFTDSGYWGSHFTPKALQDTQFTPVRVDDSCQLASVPCGSAKTPWAPSAEKSWLVGYLPIILWAEHHGKGFHILTFSSFFVFLWIPDNPADTFLFGLSISNKLQLCLYNFR